MFLKNLFKNLFSPASSSNEEMAKPVTSSNKTIKTTSCHLITSDEVWDKIDEAKNRNKHSILFKNATISASLAKELHEEGLRIKLNNSIDNPNVQIFC